jgi:hypothetical protein
MQLGKDLTVRGIRKFNDGWDALIKQVHPDTTSDQEDKQE